MKTRFAFALLLACAAPATAQTAPAPAPPPAAAPVDNLVRVALETEAGRIVIAVDHVHAPVTAANFLKYVDGGKFNGESIYRAMPYGDGGLVQGGITSDARKLLPPVAHEPTGKTGLKHVAGSVSLANLGPGTGQADFFILTTDIPALDADASNAGFAVFGRVVEGLEVVKKILASPVSPTRGEGALKGQMLEPAIGIVKSERLPD